MSADEQKKKAAQAAMRWVRPGMVLGVGTGSTVNHFIEALGRSGERPEAVIASSEATAARLRALDLPLAELNHVNGIDVYVDGADEANAQLQLIKGGGGALTREKICAAASAQFVCIVDAGKRVDVLGDFRVPVEVLPMAQALVARAIVAMGGEPRLRIGFTTDNGNVILDVDFGHILDPLGLEKAIKGLTGVVEVGIFAARRADRLLVGTDAGVEEATAR
jgi:ribose 5-phosphate isomerase A